MSEIQNIEYTTLLRDIITDIKTTRVVVAHKINSAMMQLYWNIGRRLSIDVAERGYGSNVVKRLSADLTLEFPDLAGFSPRNLWDMKKFYEYYACADTKLRQCVAVLPWKHKLADEKVQQSAAFLPWMHNVLISRNEIFIFSFQKKFVIL